MSIWNLEAIRWSPIREEGVGLRVEVTITCGREDKREREARGWEEEGPSVEGVAGMLRDMAEHLEGDAAQ